MKFDRQHKFAPETESLHSRPPLERMLRIHQAVSAGQFPNASSLALEIEVATKTIHRDIEFMRDRLNLPIEFDGHRNGYHYTEKVSANWFKFIFPFSYWSDVLETAAVLADLGYGSDPRLAPVLQLILDKQDAAGRWKLENTLNGKMWIDVEKKGQPSKWITLRALRVLKRSKLI